MPPHDLMVLPALAVRLRVPVWLGLHLLLILALIEVARSAGSNNVLLVLIDDVGIDRVRGYAAAPNCGPTPTLDALIAEGVRFDNCWAMPLCSPTRATVLTGRYAFRTGIGSNIHYEPGDATLDLAEWTIPEVLAIGAGGAVRSAAIGKWHVGPADGLEGPPPMRAGFELSSGALGNLGGEGDDWVWWDFSKRTPTGKLAVTRYATTDEVEDARRAIEGFGDDPWFVYLAFHSAHTPYHAPPPELHDRSLTAPPLDSKSVHHKAMIQALDTELGRLLNELAPDVRARTTVIVLGDNGTPGGASEPPFDPTHGKGTLYEGGVHVPLIVAGPAVAAGARGRSCAALVQATDLFATSAALFGVDARAVVPPDVALDSLDLSPYLVDPDAPSARPVIYSERFKLKPDGVHYASHRRAVRGARYKLLRDELTGVDELFDLALDPLEQRDLLATGSSLPDDARQAYFDLVRWLDTFTD